MQSRRILVTSGLPYANGPIHLGHAVEYVQTDIWARFQRLRGHECWYVCADDTHGTPIMLKAQAEGLSPEELIARVKEEHLRDFADLGVAFDCYHSTHSIENRRLVELIYARLDAAELILRKATWLYDNGKPCGREANMAKYLCADAGFGAADRALQTHGGMGYSEEYNISRFFRESRLMKIAPVSQEMILNFLSANVLGLPKSY